MESINNQLTDQWKADRLGKFTSSAIGCLIGKPRSKDKLFTEKAETYIYAKIGETLTLEANEVSSAAIKWGEEHEADAIAAFEKASGFSVAGFGKGNPVFFPYKDDPAHAGGSPDGMIYGIALPSGASPADVVIEVKCPYESKYHAEVLHKVGVGSFNLREYDADYYAQVQANMMFTGAAGAYFISYDPRVVDYKYCVVWSFVARDEEFIAELKARLDQAIEIKKDTLREMGFYSQQNQAA